MKTLKEFIHESFDSKPAVFRLTSDEDELVIYSFVLNKKKFVVEFNIGFSGYLPVAEVSFFLANKPLDFTIQNNEGINPFTVFVTVIEIIKDFVKRKKNEFEEGDIEAITFFSFKTEDGKVTNRTSIYKRMAKRILPSSWKVETTEDSDGTEFNIIPK